MNRHDDAEQRVRAWLHEEARGELPDRALSQAFATTRSSPQQRGLRGRLRSKRHQTHRTTRRRNDMFALATISATAAAVILAVNVFVDVTPPPPPGAEAPTITVEEQQFSGSFAYGPSCSDGNGESIDDCWVQEGVRFDDPRFDGTVEMRANADYTEQGIYRNQFTITTDEGAWVGDPVPGILTSPDDGLPSVHLFTGEGAYEGMYAVATIDLEFGAFVVEGYVVHGGFPELTGS